MDSEKNSYTPKEYFLRLRDAYIFYHFGILKHILMIENIQQRSIASVDK